MEQTESGRRVSGGCPTHADLLASPLEFISEDHLRERQICAVIDGLIMAISLDRKAALAVLRFVNEELNVHLRDEAEDLFPLLMQRCTAEDAIEDTLDRIKADQQAVIRLLPDVRVALAGCLDTGADLSASERAILTQFAVHMRHHLVVENAILLPIARVRLTQADLRLLSDHMRARRGLAQDPESNHAE